MIFLVGIALHWLFDFLLNETPQLPTFMREAASVNFESAGKSEFLAGRSATRGSEKPPLLIFRSSAVAPVISSEGEGFVLIEAPL